MGLRDELLAISDLPVKQVNFKGVPGWEGRTDVYVRVMTGHDANDYEAFACPINEKGDVMVNRQDVWAKLTVLAACDADGNRIFANGDLALVTQKSRRALERIFDAAQDLNGMAPPKLDANGKATSDPNSPSEAGAGSSNGSATTSGS